MGRNKQNRRTSKPMQPTQPIQTATQLSLNHPNDGEQPKSVVTWKEILPVVAILISFSGAVFSYQQHNVSKAALEVSKNSLDISKNTLDRAAGKMAAKIELADFSPLPKDFRDDQKGTPPTNSVLDAFVRLGGDTTH